MTARRAAALAALLTVLLITLIPAPGNGATRSPWCLLCGGQGLTDFIANVLLVVPLGAALAALGWPVWRVAVAGLVLSAGIEALQVFVVTGRDASMGDVAANASGALLGALLWAGRSTLLRPAGTGSMLAAAGAVVALASLTAWLFQPVPAPRHRCDLLIRGAHADYAGLRPYRRAASFKLAIPTSWVDHAVVGIEAEEARRLLRRGQAERCLPRDTLLGFGSDVSVTRGWAMLHDAPRRLQPYVDGLWLALLFMALGFWSRRGDLPVAGPAVGLYFMLVLPLISSLAPAPWTAWLGAAAGLGLGAWLRAALTSPFPRTA